MEIIENNELIQKLESEDSKEFIAKFSKENLKSLFYMLSGKPDSITQPLPRKVTLKIEDIKHLNNKITEKLNHYVNEVAIVVDITYENGMSKEFGVWNEFETHDWQVPLITQTITIKWDFLIQLPSHLLPQRHTITVRIQEFPEELEAIQALFSTLGDGRMNAEIGIVSTIVRVDFINHLLSQELVNIVTEWNESLEIPNVQETFFIKIKQKKKTIAQIIHYSIPIVTTILAGAISRNRIALWGVNSNLTLAHFEFAMFWLLGTGISICLTNLLGRELARQTYKSVRKYGEYRTFLITSGDKNKQNGLENKNKMLVQTFLMTTLFTIVINVIAGLITWWLTKP